MRKIVPSQIIDKKYSIIDNKVVETNNGDYYSKNIAKLVLISMNHSDKKNIEKLKRDDKKEFEKAAREVLLQKSKSLSNNMELVLTEKQFEIIKLESLTEKYYLINTNDINIKEDYKNAELYFSLSNAKKILKAYKYINESLISTSNDLKKIHNAEIIECKEEIEKIKIKDNEEYVESIKLYQKIKKSGILEKYNNLLDENKKLSRRNKKLKEQNENLEKKLRFTLERYESKLKEEHEDGVVSKFLKKLKK